jgi:hypothetical protein
MKAYCGLYTINSITFRFGMTVQFEFHKICNKSIATYFIVLSQNSSERTEKKHETFSRG